jgi:hypothetical protein
MTSSGRPPADPHRYRQIKNILADLLERPAHERAGMLTARCGTDAALRSEVEALLAYEADDDFLEPGAARAELMKERRVLKIVASRNGEVVWTDRVPHDANAPLGRTGVISIPPFEIELSIETLGDAVADETQKLPGVRG